MKPHEKKRLRANVRKIPFVSIGFCQKKARAAIEQFEKHSGISKKTMRLVEEKKGSEKLRSTSSANSIFGLVEKPNESRFVSDTWRKLKYYTSIHAYFLKYVGAPRGKRVLHLAASTGIYSRFLQEHGATAVPLDINKAYLGIAKQLGNKSAVVADSKITKNTRYLPFADNSFDALISDHFLFSTYKAIENPKNHLFTGNDFLPHEGSYRILDEIHRVLKPQGIAIIYYLEGTPWLSLNRIRKGGFSTLAYSSNIAHLPNQDPKLRFPVLILRKVSSVKKHQPKP